MSEHRIRNRFDAIGQCHIFQVRGIDEIIGADTLYLPGQQQFLQIPKLFEYFTRNVIDFPLIARRPRQPKIHRNYFRGIYVTVDVQRVFAVQCEWLTYVTGEWVHNARWSIAPHTCCIYSIAIRPVRMHGDRTSH